MTLLEIAFVLATGALLGSAFFTTRKPWLVAAAAVALAAHLAVDGYRWQFVPTYLVFVFAAGKLLIGRGAAPFGRIVALALGSLVATSMFLALALPVFELSKPSGNAAVGVTQRFLTDPSRLEAHTRAPDDHRRLAVRIWYPGESTDQPAVPYWPHDPQRDGLMVRGLGLPAGFGFMFSHVRRVTSHAVADAAIAEGRHPVIVFSHGMAFGYSGQNTVLMEQLASHGYVVVSIDHSYWGLYNRFPDGTRADSVAVQNRFRQLWANAAPLGALDEELVTDLPVDRLEQVMLEVMERRPAVDAAMQQGIDLWLADQRFVIDELERLTEEDTLLQSRLDLGRLGIMGMSLGGTVSIHTCVVEPRCAAAANLDGFQPNSVRLPALEVPSLHIASATNFWTQYSHWRAAGKSYHVRFADTQHANFSDFALFTPLLRGSQILGAADGTDVINATNDYVLAFFDSVLHQRDSVLLDAEHRPTVNVQLDVR